MAFYITPSCNLNEIKRLRDEVNKLLEKYGLSVEIAYSEEIDTYCLTLYRGNDFKGQLGACVSKHQLWRIYERLLVIYMVLERINEAIRVV